MSDALEPRKQDEEREPPADRDFNMDELEDLEDLGAPDMALARESTEQRAWRW